MRNRNFARSDGLQSAPGLECVTGGTDREGDVFLARLRDLGERLLGRRRDRREPGPRPRRDVLAADEEAVSALERDDVPRLGRGA